MSWRAMEAVLEQSRCKGSARLVLVTIASHADKDLTGACPSIATIARKANVHEDTVHRAIKAAVKAGELRVDERQGRPHLYEFTLPTPPQRAPAQSVTPSQAAAEPPRKLPPTPPQAAGANRSNRTTTEHLAHERAGRQDQVGEEEEVFNHLLMVTDSLTGPSNPGRRRHIAARLAAGFSVQDLKKAADNAARQDFYQGTNTYTGRPLMEPSTIYRTDEKVRELLAWRDRAKPKEPDYFADRAARLKLVREANERDAEQRRQWDRERELERRPGEVEARDVDAGQVGRLVLGVAPGPEPVAVQPGAHGAHDIALHDVLGAQVATRDGGDVAGIADGDGGAHVAAPRSGTAGTIPPGGNPAKRPWSPARTSAGRAPTRATARTRCGSPRGRGRATTATRGSARWARVARSTEHK